MPSVAGDQIGGRNLLTDDFLRQLINWRSRHSCGPATHNKPRRSGGRAIHPDRNPALVSPGPGRHHQSRWVSGWNSRTGYGISIDDLRPVPIFMRSALCTASAPYGSIHRVRSHCGPFLLPLNCFAASVYRNVSGFPTPKTPGFKAPATYSYDGFDLVTPIPRHKFDDSLSQFALSIFERSTAQNP